MKVAVFGAGVIGVCSAWWLAKSGHEVVVVDRRAGPALETSRAGAGLVPAGHAQPWASPHALRPLLHGSGRIDAPFSVALRLSPHQWLWCLRFLAQCRHARLSANRQALVNLVQYSRGVLRSLRTDLDIACDHSARGVLTLYRDAGMMARARAAVPDLAEWGVQRRAVDRDEILRLEPALSPAIENIVGADYWADDEAGDAYLFTRALAEHARAAGVDFHFNTRVNRLVPVNGRVSVAELVDPDGFFRPLNADAFVLALGSFTPMLTRPLGVSCAVYPAKGYSATFGVRDASAAPGIGLVDEAAGVTVTRLGDRLRITGTAEIGNYSRALNTARCNQLVEQARALFPSALDFDNVQFWSGLRPATPSGVPLIGRTRLRNLYLNTGHGPLGWAMGAGSGRALADLVSGRLPDVDFPFLD
ncbi:MAG: FAD-dependent oxidoreductase [Castellaniella sp.]|uniref:D-amino acid dehydrogenase n=1 Tax=Castellaniella sp. TaxID=1955812 RepID=UPI0011F72664|nr:D-amino acid dehydrogenase [Castellaniella sp.]TAN26593.1 MAG: FAD-dependent oxidoreductase [Castellaniella sp.]